MGYWEQGVWVRALEWRRVLLEREENLVQTLLVTLNNVSLSADSVDVWRWEATTNGVYSTKSAYKLLSRKGQSPFVGKDDEAVKNIWKTPAPFKAKITGWRILIDRMATCENLKKRNIVIDAGEDMCVACRNHVETTSHFFFSCSESGELWKEMLGWMDVQSVNANNTKTHLTMFKNLGGKLDIGFLSGVWCAVVWCLWKCRNDIKFNQAVWDRGKICQDIKSRLWSWKVAYGIQVKSLEFEKWFLKVELLGG